MFSSWFLSLTAHRCLTNNSGMRIKVPRRRCRLLGDVAIGGLEAPPDAAPPHLRYQTAQRAAARFGAPDAFGDQYGFAAAARRAARDPFRAGIVDDVDELVRHRVEAKPVGDSKSRGKSVVVL